MIGFAGEDLKTVAMERVDAAYVMDFVDGVHQLDVRAYGFETLAEALAKVDQVGNHARFCFDGDVLFVLHIEADDLNNDIVI